MPIYSLYSIWDPQNKYTFIRVIRFVTPVAFINKLYWSVSTCLTQLKVVLDKYLHSNIVQIYVTEVLEEVRCLNVLLLLTIGNV